MMSNEPELFSPMSKLIETKLSQLDKKEGEISLFFINL